MFISPNEKCPVCHKELSNTDDVVVICPQCGTPHHKECYNSLGHCFNEDKHKDGFEYSFANEPESVGDNQPQVNENTDGGTNNPQSNAKNDRYTTMFMPAASPYDNDESEIEGKKICDISATVRTNSQRFIPKFIKNKSVSWNWGGLFFGPYYLLFRKIYTPGIILLAISLIVQFVVNGVFYQQISHYTAFISANAQTIMSQEFLLNPDTELLEQMTTLANEIYPAIAIIAGVRILIHLVTALFADKLYRARVLSLISKVDETLENGGSLESPLFAQSISPKEMRRLYLGKIGGTNLFVPMLCWLIIDLVTSFIQ